MRKKSACMKCSLGQTNERSDAKVPISDAIWPLIMLLLSQQIVEPAGLDEEHRVCRRPSADHVNSVSQR